LTNKITLLLKKNDTRTNGKTRPTPFLDQLLDGVHTAEKIRFSQEFSAKRKQTNPMLCRVPINFSPGFPKPTIRRALLLFLVEEDLLENALLRHPLISKTDSKQHC
jgi:hypothetical protein